MGALAKTNQAIHSTIEFRLNGNRIGSSFFGSTINTWRAGSLHANLKLQTGDEVTLQLSAEPLYDDLNIYTHFTGILLEEDLVIPWLNLCVCIGQLFICNCSMINLFARIGESIHKIQVVLQPWIHNKKYFKIPLVFFITVYGVLCLPVWIFLPLLVYRLSLLTSLL